MPTTKRQIEPELMDQPGLDAARHVHALKGLRRINQWSSTVGALDRALTRLAHDRGRHELRVLDLACGGGDILIRLVRRAESHGLRLRATGGDINPRAVEYAREKAHASRLAIDFIRLDALRDPLPGDCDAVICSLFMHHLTDAEAIALLRRMAAAARGLVAVDDLRRHPAGTALAVVGMRFLTRSSVVHVDGLRSVRAAYTMEEAAGLAHEAGLEGCDIRPHWPFRFLLTWRKG